VRWDEVRGLGPDAGLRRALAKAQRLVDRGPRVRHADEA
jgi:hypothetical protein